eukprot:CAMPEP_0204385358 /NCGR_PEP_ID=MMETSP0469-20131031/57636_1 /ASSEMBLY_ACC=CAM_ASM_000384 /TAXON_ID=2969 /ORGANISM="Oxyrrhis marina" /LENGTH=67 /DNA_ID=CAMNT_0051378271 /DNA_START=7 /DNA_END=207 /DNA_ORIENTATION=-
MTTAMCMIVSGSILTDRRVASAAWAGVPTEVRIPAPTDPKHTCRSVNNFPLTADARTASNSTALPSS